MAKFNRRTVNKALADAGIKAELFHGRGYWYFGGDDVAHAFSTSVAVYRIDSFTVDEWVNEARVMAAESRENAPTVSK